MVGVAFETKIPPKYGAFVQKKSSAKKLLWGTFLENLAYTNQIYPQTSIEPNMVHFTWTTKSGTMVSFTRSTELKSSFPLAKQYLRYLESIRTYSQFLKTTKNDTLFFYYKYQY